MSLLVVARTEALGQRVCVRWPHTYEATFFAAPAPPAAVLVTVTIPQGVGSTPRDVAAHYGGVPRADGDAVELPPGAWRRTVAEDLASELYGPEYLPLDPWDFPLADVEAFATRWTPVACGRVRAALAAPPRERLEALAHDQWFVRQVTLLVAILPHAMEHEAAGLERALAAGAPAARIDLAATLRSDAVATEVLCAVATEMAAPAFDDAQIDSLLRRIEADSRLKRLSERAPEFWHPLARRLRLDANVEGETLDLTHAVEVTVTLSWDVLRGRRVGAIVAGRSALQVGHGDGATWVRGGRQLLQTITRAGGSLTRMRNTLTVATDPTRDAQAALLELDRIDVLAQLAPRQALERVAALGLPATHPVFSAAADVERGATGAGRRLADLLIELRTGLDADIARARARAQARQNRRRRMG